LSDRPDLLTLSFGVTYWDELGWKDTFASAQFTARQWDYAHAFHRAEVFTPQVVVNGRARLKATLQRAFLSIGEFFVPSGNKPFSERSHAEDGNEYAKCSAEISSGTPPNLRSRPRWPP
jgi:hypothetical protein